MSTRATQCLPLYFILHGSTGVPQFSSISATTAGSSSSSSFSSSALCLLTDCRQTSEAHADNYCIELFSFCARCVNESNLVSICWLHLSAILSPIWYIADNINIRPKCIIFHWKWYCSTTREFIPKKKYYLQLLTSVLVLWVDGDTLGLPWFAETVMTKMWCCLW